ERRHHSWRTKETGPEEDDRPRRVALLKFLSGDQRFQGDAIRDHQRRAGLLDDALLFESGEKTAYGLARGADHLSDLFVRQRKFHLAGILGFGVLVEPCHQQPGKLFAGRVGKDEVTNFTAGARVIGADVLCYPEGKVTVLAHEAKQIALAQVADLGGFLGLGRRFILAAGNHGGHAQGATGFDDAENQRAAVTAANGELHPATTHNEYAARSLSLGKQNRSCGIAGGEGILLKGIGYGWGKIAKHLVYSCKLLSMVDRLCGHECCLRSYVLWQLLRHSYCKGPTLERFCKWQKI